MKTDELPPHPGQVLLHMYLLPLGITQVDLAEHLGISFQRVNEIVNGKRAITAETAWLLSQAFLTGPQYWMDMQTRWDLAMHFIQNELRSVTPLVRMKGRTS